MIDQYRKLVLDVRALLDNTVQTFRANRINYNVEITLFGGDCYRYAGDDKASSCQIITNGADLANALSGEAKHEALGVHQALRVADKSASDFASRLRKVSAELDPVLPPELKISVQSTRKSFRQGQRTSYKMSLDLDGMPMLRKRAIQEVGTQCPAFDILERALIARNNTLSEHRSSETAHRRIFLFWIHSGRAPMQREAIAVPATSEACARALVDDVGMIGSILPRNSTDDGVDVHAVFEIHPSAGP